MKLNNNCYRWEDGGNLPVDSINVYHNTTGSYDNATPK